MLYILFKIKSSDLFVLQLCHILEGYFVSFASGKNDHYVMVKDFFSFFNITVANPQRPVVMVNADSSKTLHF